MMDDLSQRIADAKDRLRTKQKLAAMISRADEARDLESSRSRQLKGQLDKEKADVDRLEGMSLAAMLHTFLGTKLLAKAQLATGRLSLGYRLHGAELVVDRRPCPSAARTSC
jgi:hypothetical protein